MKAHRRLKAGRLAVGNPSARDEAVLNWGGSRADSMLFDFASDTGAIGDIHSSRLLPAGAVVTGIVLNELTNLTSAGSATITIKAGSTALSTAIAFGSVVTGTTPLAASATAIPLTVDSELIMSIGAAALTAGKLRIHVTYLLPNN